VECGYRELTLSYIHKAEDSWYRASAPAYIKHRYRLEAYAAAFSLYSFRSLERCFLPPDKLSMKLKVKPWAKIRVLWGDQLPPKGSERTLPEVLTQKVKRDALLAPDRRDILR
jgi:hypothetical protein